MNDQIIGIIEEIIFHNEENGYVIAVVEVDGEYHTVKGYIPFVEIGQMMKFQGTYVENLLYGEQFDVSTSEIVFPKDKDAIQRYLSSGLISGIGEIRAKQIVDAFGEDALDIIVQDPNRLLEINGIGSKKAQRIYEDLQRTKAIKYAMMFLKKYGISTNLAMRIYKIYGDDTKDKILDNPYCLVDDVVGIGFKTADEIAQKIGISFDAPERILPAIDYILKKNINNGDTYFLEDELVDATAMELSVSSDIVKKQLGNAIIDGRLFVDNSCNEIRIYSPILYYAESKVCQKLLEISSFTPSVCNDVDKRIEDFENRVGITLASEQKKAVRKSASSGILVITGGPGTGKTTIINAILEVFESRNMTVLLTAPTGRAAKRMEETTGRAAKTIHRLLEYTYNEEQQRGMFNKNEDNPIQADVLIIDESSMMDILLTSSLLQAVQLGTQIIFVGDVDQLPSVGAGTVLKDIITSDVAAVVRLTDIYRQSDESLIAVNAHRINAGEMPYINEKDKDFFFIEQSSQLSVANIIGELVSKRLPNHYGFNPVDDIQVLSPTKRGKTGIIALNKSIQHLINPYSVHKEEMNIGEQLFRVGDKVMQIKNDYKLKWKFYEEKGESVFNGDIGIIEDIDTSNKTVNIVFDDKRRAVYEFAQMNMLMHAYAITVHKSQGSEFPVIVMPIVMGAPMLMNRNILYTALTRAKKLVVLVGSKKTLQYMIHNNMPSGRKSGLCDRLKKLMIEEFIEKDSR